MTQTETSRVAAWLVTSVLAWAACGETAEPSGRPHADSVVVVVGDTLTFAAGQGSGAWTLTHAAGRELNVFLQVTGGGAGQHRSLRVRNAVVLTDPDILSPASAPGNLSAGPAVASAVGDQRFDGQATGRFYLDRDTTYLFDVTGDSVPFRVWFYPIDRRPETRDSVIPGNGVVQGEAIDQVGDIDRFAFSAAAGDLYNLFLHPESGTAATAVAGLVPAMRTASNATPVVHATGADTLMLTASGRFRADSAGGYRLYVYGESSRDTADTGPYQVVLYHIDPLPESTDSALAPGAVTSEGIDQLGDLDRFRFDVPAGAEYNLFLRAARGNPATRIRATVASAPQYPPSALATLEADGLDTLIRNASGIFRPQSPGTYRVFVEGETSTAHADRGPYEMLLYRINRDPEDAPATLAWGDNAVETIERLGDIDQFTLPVAAESVLAGFILEHRSAQYDHGLVMFLTDNPSDPYLPDPNGQPSSRAYLGVATLAPGRAYQLRVFGQDRGSGYEGPYVLRAYQINRLPETVDSMVALGDSILDEAIDPPGDIDTYHFDGLAGQHIKLTLVGTGPPPALGGFETVLTCPGQSVGQLSRVTAQGPSRITLPVTGRYTFTVSPVNRFLDEQGPYRVDLRELSGLPEAAGQALSPGDSVIAEAIDELGDVDEFVVTGTPDSTLIVLLQGPGGGLLKAAVVDDATRDTVAVARSAGTVESSGMVTFPASGTLRLRVSEREDDCTTGEYLITGPYKLWAVAVSRGPETVSSVFALGDTVRGEAISPAGDIDEFPVTAAAGDSLVGYFRLPLGAEAGDLMLEVLEAAGDTVLATARISAGTMALGPIPIPADGTYLVRVRGGYPWGRAAYEFHFR